MFYRQIWFGDWKSISSPNRIPDWHACMETLPCDSFAMNIDFTRMTKCILLEKQQLFQPPTFPDSDLVGGNHQGWLLSFRLSLLPPQARWTIYRTHRPIPSIPSWKNLKVILHGEHAVVYGMTAVGASLDLRTSITIKPHPSKVSLSQWLSPWHLPVTKSHDRAPFPETKSTFYLSGCRSLSRLGPQRLLDNCSAQRAFQVLLKISYMEPIEVLNEPFSGTAQNPGAVCAPIIWTVFMISLESTRPILEWLG